MLAGPVGDDDMPSLNARFVGEQRAQRARIDTRCVLISFRRGVENDCDGNQFRTPDDRL